MKKEVFITIAEESLKEMQWVIANLPFLIFQEILELPAEELMILIADQWVATRFQRIARSQPRAYSSILASSHSDREYLFLADSTTEDDISGTDYRQLYMLLGKQSNVHRLAKLWDELNIFEMSSFIGLELLNLEPPVVEQLKERLKQLHGARSLALANKTYGISLGRDTLGSVLAEGYILRAYARNIQEVRKSPI